MGLLSDDLVRAYFGSGVWSVVLENGDKQVAELKPSWTVSGSAGSASVMFMFDRYVKFDGVCVLRDGVEVDRAALGLVSLPPGAEWQHDLQVMLSEV